MQKEIYRLMLIHGFKPNHKLDQNFIIDKNSISKVIETIKPNKEETVLEIGPGLGFVTKELLKVFKKVIAIEKDPIMVEILKKEYPDKNLEIIHSDFLEVDLSKLKFDKIVGFIPYSISLKIIDKIIATKPACLVVQKEFAEKLVAYEGFANYVSISVLLQSHSDIKNIRNIRKASFFPKPKVDSSIVSIIPKKNTKVDDNYNQFIKNIFRYPNKDIVNSFKHSNSENKEIISLDKIKLIPEKLQTKKVKQISVKEFEKIYNLIKK
ncbi:ribosomal RNA small subunit methyltransferase A [archaeon]|nr:ribosomal RNA small subunit methyltransferase A [archaeon]NCP79622.1 ribosomal RNA small subunit methyltransferase A [archaeon]NCP98307.1 ribosomal RNA small subunit methyltransferase A [archaeon]NCQ07389.1 ribosomal RNA small subunit methyltransferase A [archaeon]NCQ51185.1 ribosomal RNA small subunit methyltransferase A [archaeon]